MKRGWMLSAAVGVLLSLSGCGSTNTMQGLPANATVVKVTATNFKWTLSQTTFKVGQPYHFEVSSANGAHGFNIIGTKIDQTVSEGQAPIDAGWTPTTAGTYTLRCNQYCGSGHPNMFITLTVTK